MRSRSYIYATLPDFKYPAMFDMMLKGLHNRGHVVTAGDSADKDIAGPSRTGSTTLFGDEAGLHVREG